jgi:hypothetical protein
LEKKKVQFVKIKKSDTVYYTCKQFGVLFLYHALAELFCQPLGQQINDVKDYRDKIRHLVPYIDKIDPTISNFASIFSAFDYNNTAPTDRSCLFEFATNYAFSPATSAGYILNEITLGQDFFLNDPIEYKGLLTQYVESHWKSRDSRDLVDQNFLFLHFSKEEARKVKNLKIPLSLRLDDTIGEADTKVYVYYRLVGVFYVNDKGIDPFVCLVTKEGLEDCHYFRSQIPTCNYFKVPETRMELVKEAAKIPFNMSSNKGEKFHAIGSCWVKCFDRHRYSESETEYLSPLDIYHGEISFTYQYINSICNKNGWLNDETIQLFLSKGMEHFKRIFKMKERLVVMNTHFYSMFCDDGDKERYERVARWTKDQYKNGNTLFDDDVVMHIPINYPVNVHWIHVYVHMKSKAISIIDSQHNLENEKHVGKIVKRYLELEHNTKLNSALPDQWEFYYNHETPTQTDGFSCGIFLLLNVFRLMYLQAYGKLSGTYEWKARINKSTLTKVRFVVRDILCGNSNIESLLPFIMDDI